MGLAERVKDALVLWEQGRHEGALLNALIAVAASSRRQYPRPMPDKEAFVSFLEPRIVEVSRVSMAGVEFRGKMYTPAELLYKWFRCELAHEGELPADVEFVEKPGFYIRAGGSPGPSLQISHAWFWVLIRAVTEADVNQDLFPGREGVGTAF